MTTFGEPALLRTGGLPIRLWLDAANPPLFARLRRVERLRSRCHRVGAALAAEIGDVLVTDPAIGPAQRRLALACRRRLHRGDATDQTRLAALAEATRAAGQPRLAERILAAAVLGAELRDESDRAAAAVATEQDRLLAGPWASLTGCAVGRRALADGTIAAGEDTERRLRAGTGWSSKRLRQRSEYLWRMIERGTVKTTPRGWFGHVTLLTVGPDGPGPDAPGRLLLAEDVAARWTENLHEGRRSATARPVLEPTTVLALSPLHRVDGDHLRVWSVHPERTEAVQPVQVRLSPALARLYALLRDGARTVAEVEAGMLPATAPELTAPEPPAAAGRAELRPFLAHLVRLGICQASTEPRVLRTGWAPAGSGPAGPAGLAGLADPETPGFLDVYRRTGTAWPAASRDLLTSAVGLLSRLTAAIEEDRPAPADPFDQIDAEPRPILDLLTEHLDTLDPDAVVTAPRPPSVWPAAHRAGSAYDRLLGWLAARPTGPGTSADITADLLDTVGAPTTAFDWPVDCLVRPVRGGPVALDAVRPAGILDSRFAGELATLHGSLPQVQAYREFLHALDAETGIPSVELLVPPQSIWAANAVRRPLYTRYWTGDADLRSYCPADPADATYLPLDDLTVRRADGRLLVEAGGRPVRVVYHATRMAAQPWDVLLSVLMAGSRMAGARYRRLRHSLSALPDRRHVPRITLAGSVILTPTQWLLEPGDLWDPRDPAAAKAAALTRLRDRLGLPRWVMVRAASHDRRRACDLDSLRALAVLEAYAEEVAAGADAPAGAGADGVVIEEMVPTPDELVVRDSAAGADPVVAELMLRLPAGVDPAVLARAAAQADSGAPGRRPGQRGQAPAA